MLDAATMARLRAMLGPGPDRYDFATVMQRWEAEVLGEPPADISLVQAPGSDQFEWPSDRPEDGAEHLASQITRMPGRPWGQSIQGRPRGDVERDAAFGLGVIFYEYTGRLKPNRDAWDDYTRITKPSLFRLFATDAFRAIGLEPSHQAFREACEKWDKLPKRAMQQQILQGGLASKRRKSKR
jgi:hypothetical protein